MAKAKTDTPVTPAAGAAPAAAPAPKPEKVAQNGVTRPKPETTTGKVWGIADALSEKAGKPAPRKDVLEQANAAGINPATTATQYGKWRKFHGLKGRGTEEEAAPAAGAEAAKS